MRKIYGSLVPVAQGPDVRAWVFGNSFRELPSLAAVARAGESPVKGKVLPPKSAVGFILIDSSLSPISFNAEAIQILSYPAKYANGPPTALLAGKIRSSLISQQSSAESPFVTEFQSGRRRYFCRAFLLGSKVGGYCHPSTAVLLERGPSELIPLSQVSKLFNLTEREREALRYLLQSLSNKEIASRMNVSTNTVKTFLRLVMGKLGVCSRSAIVRKIFMTNQNFARSSILR